MSLSKIIGYYKSWEAHIFPPENIDINTYTHINYAFLGINEDGSIRFEGSEDVVRRLSYLKGRNSRLKVLFSIGGWNEGSRKFSLVAADANKTLRFANDVVSYLNKYNFDGVDVDWEYPGQNGGCPADKNNFVNLLTTLRKELNRNGSYLLTIAVSPLADPNSYDVPAISRVVDCIKVMTYDFHQAAEGKTGQNAPLYASSMDSDWQRQNCNCHAGINKWISGGAPSTKVILGLAFYGQEYNLTTGANGLGAPTSTTGGQITYKQICQIRGTTVWDDEQKVPYMYSGNRWIGYDNQRSISLKVQYARSRGLGGVMVWTLNDDNGQLLSTIKANM